MNHAPKNLSGNKRRCIAITRALINDPDLFIVNDSIGNFDSLERLLKNILLN
ncbi:MAG: hypothetical protein ACFFAN_07505 [Promethearchaeota archaeon]